MSSLMSIGEIMKERPAVDPKALASNLRFSKVREDLKTRVERPTVFVEGVIREINLGDKLPVEVTLIEDENGEVKNAAGLCAKFQSDKKSLSGKYSYIYVFDYRKIQTAIFRQFGFETWFNHINDHPCLGTMRKGKCLYVALADIGDKDCDIIAENGYQNLYLLRAPINKLIYRVIVENDLTAIHPATGICIAEKR